MGKRGILLMNVGTPDEPTTTSIRKYLREFLLDPDVIDLPTPLRHLLVRGIILQTRPKKITPRYQSIWMDEGSPLRVYTERLTHSLEASLEDIRCEVGMRYGGPSIRKGLDKLKKSGVDELLLLPLFPQYAQATTESAFKQAYKQLNTLKWNPKISKIPYFPNSPEFIDSLLELIIPTLSKDTHLLFSYHGLPISHLKKGDPTGKHCQKIDKCCTIKVEANTTCYARHCMLTTQSIVERLGLDESRWSISFQSRLGLTKWLEPSTKKTIEKLVINGKKKIVIVSPAFLTDGLETLEELNIQIREHFIKHGGEELIVVNCLNDNPTWIKGLGKLVLNAFNSQNFVDSES